jgi:pentapeptide MXKDX repeat protein
LPPLQDIYLKTAVTASGLDANSPAQPLKEIPMKAFLIVPAIALFFAAAQADGTTGAMKADGAMKTDAMKAGAMTSGAMKKDGAMTAGAMKKDGAMKKGAKKADAMKSDAGMKSGAMTSGAMKTDAMTTPH